MAFELQQRAIPMAVMDRQAPETLLELLKKWEVNLQVILGFSRILPPQLLNGAEFGTCNIHASPLPAYRGAMPLFWQIRRGEHASALTLHHAVAEPDAGNILLAEPLKIHSLETFASFALAIAHRAPLLIERLVEQIFAHGRLPTGTPQSGEVTQAPTPKPEQLVVHWADMSPADIVNLARACNGFVGGATFYWRGIPLALLQATVVDHPLHGVKPGTVLLVAEPEGLVIAARDGAVRLDVIATAEGIFSGIAFAERFGLDAGVRLQSTAN